MATRDELQALMDRGFALVPIRPRTKQPSSFNWPSDDFTLDDFEPDSNIGVKLGQVSGGLVDIDCDTDLAARIAHELLPITLSFGRPSRPHSHYLFRATDRKDDLPGTKAWKSLTGANLLELRGEGGQTVIPPSIHESGEPIAWDDPTRKPLHLPYDDLLQWGHRIAVTSLLAQHWPSSRRHEFAGHVGGFLARYLPDSTVVSRMVAIAARHAGDEEVEDRRRYALETAEKHAAGVAVTGAPRVRELMDAGAAFVAYVRKCFGDEGLNQLEELNEQYFVVQLGNSMVVGHEPKHAHEAVIFQPFAEFEKKYMHRRAGKQPLGKAWLTYPERRQYERVVFVPPGSREAVAEGDYNLWQGFAVAPLDGDPLPHLDWYLSHIRDVIANGDERIAAYIVDLLADCVQKPGDPPGKALVMRGSYGTGKSIFIEAFGALFGRSFASVNHREQLTGSFNAHLSGKVVLFADDAVWGGRKEDAGTLRYLVTQRKLMIQRKHVDRSVEPNYLHLFLSTNESWAWPAGNKERRGIIVDTGEPRPREYYNRLVEETHKPEFRPALLRYLLERPVDRDRLLAGLSTRALRDQMEQSAGPEQQWWHMILEDGTWKGDPWPEFITQDALYDQFVVDMGSQRGAGVSHRGTRMLFTRRLMGMLPPSARVTTRAVRENVYEGVRGMAPEWQTKTRKAVVLPRLSVCREYFDRFTGFAHDWPDVTAVPQELDL